MNQSVMSEILKIARNQPTPFYYYDLDQAKLQFARVQSAVGSGIRLYYSAKANSHSKILSLAKNCGVAIDVASGAELSRALVAGFRPQEISYTGPGKRIEELKSAVNLNIDRIVIESIGELEYLANIGQEFKKIPRIAIRMSPRKRLNHVGREIVNRPNQFGFSEENFEALIQKLILLKEKVHLVGLHVHAQSHVIAFKHVIENFRNTRLAAERFLKLLGNRVSLASEFEITLGGGFGVSYSQTGNEFDLDGFSKALKEFFLEESELKTLLKTVPHRYSIELGRYLVANAGYFVSSILYTKSVQIDGREAIYAIADGGFPQCQIACGVGQLMRSNLPYVFVDKAAVVRREGGVRINVVGPTCYSQDILLADIELDHIEPGDVLIMKNVGAYGKQFSPQQFLLHPEAAEWFSRGDGDGV